VESSAPVVGRYPASTRDADDHDDSPARDHTFGECAPPASAMFPGVLLSTPALRGDSAMKEIAEIFAI
jgi:hypothetical protein